jgi:hypothetical protein
MRCLFGIGITVLTAAACSNPSPPETAKSTTTRPTYDKKTGKLTELTFDRNGNGRIDTWTDMNGAKPIRSQSDLDEDGTLDRWEYYDDQGKLVKVGMSRSNDGRPDSWAFSGPDGTVARVEVSSTSDEKAIDRWEFYRGAELMRVEQDTNADGRADNWDTYENGSLKTAAVDENADGRPDRRLTYTDGALVLIESEPDASGVFTKRVPVKDGGDL